MVRVRISRTLAIFYLLFSHLRCLPQDFLVERKQKLALNCRHTIKTMCENLPLFLCVCFFVCMYVCMHVNCSYALYSTYAEFMLLTQKVVNNMLWLWTQLAVVKCIHKNGITCYTSTMHRLVISHILILVSNLLNISWHEMKVDLCKIEMSSVIFSKDGNVAQSFILLVLLVSIALVQLYCLANAVWSGTCVY